MRAMHCLRQVLRGCSVRCVSSVAVAESPMDIFLDRLCSRAAPSRNGPSKHRLRNTTKPLARGRVKLPFTASTDADVSLEAAIAARQLDRMSSVLTQCIHNEVAPDSKLLVAAVRVCCDLQAEEVFKQARYLLKSAYPRKCEEQGNLEHYRAELLWKSGYWSESILLFGTLLDDPPVNLGRKYRTMSTFLVMQLVEQGLADHLQSVVELGRECAERSDYYLLGAVWKACFLSQRPDFQRVADELVMEEQDGIRLAISGKVEGVLQAALAQENELNTIRRCIELVLRLKLTELYPKVFAALLEHQCSHADLQGAASTVEYMRKYHIQLSTAQLAVYLGLLNHYKIQVPWMLLKMKYNGAKRAVIPSKVEPVAPFKLRF